MKKFFEYSNEVQQALSSGSPILALESTIISHGLPYPDNLETALSLEKMVRDKGVTPATIAIINGRIKIGLSENELEHLARDKHVTKASRRDLGFILSQKFSAGTTVAATLFLAAHAGIKVFSTGGIGGVHRGGHQDISADLIELARNPVAVVCAGAKAILDLPRTLEFLETFSVPVIGYRTEVLPAFYTATTKHLLPASVNDVHTLVNILKTHWELGMSSGVLITHPIPAEFAIAADKIEPVIEQAIQKAEKNTITGKSLTPFLLSEVALLTQGESIKANIALIKNNVILGAELAYALDLHQVG
jgi:pseudouridine-5'-phosphate glycosidase